MRYLTLAEVLELHRRVMEQAGGNPAVRDLGGLISAVAQPRATFEAHDLHPTATDKAAALCFSIIANDPFVDGNKRAGHAAMETFLLMNGFEIVASVDDSERVILDVGSGRIDRQGLAAWLNNCQSVKAAVAAQPNHPLQPSAGGRIAWVSVLPPPAVAERER